jgi:threonine/homoserine/homoserine lactone efflux protein
MVVIVLGMGKIFQSSTTQIVIGLAGGVFLLIMAVGMLKSSSNIQKQDAKVTKSDPLVAGVVLTGGNPYFLVWWATVGLTLATTAKGLGIWAFVLFAIVHWSCDLVWLLALSWASFKGSVLLGPQSQRVVLIVCGLALFAFGLFFVYNAGSILIRQIFTGS